MKYVFNTINRDTVLKKLVFLVVSDGYIRNPNA